MNVILPDVLKTGELARLIPAAHASQKERHAVSVILATLMVVRPFAQQVLGTIGKQVGPMTTVLGFTEVVFKNQPDDVDGRPDGLLILRTPRTEWRALVEAKLGPAKIEPRQLASYCKIARENDLDAIITLSNEFATHPDHPPYPVPPELVRFDLYHWSWRRLVTTAILLLSGEEGFDPEQQYILKEALRYFTHDNVDVRGFHQMNAEWPVLVDKVLTGAELGKSDMHIAEKTVRAWHQAQQDLCLTLCRELKLPISLRMSKYHRENQAARIADDVADLIDKKQLQGAYQIPNLAGPLEVRANLMARNVTCCLSVQAPEDRKRYESRLNWLLRQIPTDSDESVQVQIHWKNGGKTFTPLAKLRTDPEIADIKRPGTVPKQFDIIMITDLERKFSGPKTFIDGLEAAVPHFYDSVASHIDAWRPAPTPGPLDGTESLAVSVEKIERIEVVRARIAQEGTINGRRFSIFEDGSIEVETSSGTKWFKNLAALQSFDMPQRRT